MPPPSSTAARGRAWPLARLALRVFFTGLAVTYFAFCGWLYLIQERLIYPRDDVTFSPAEGAREARGALLVPWNQPAPGAASPQGYVTLDFNQPAPRGTIVVFHGNGDWAGSCGFYADAFRRRGFRTFLYEYPGYGGRPGAPHERTIVPDAQALVRELDREKLGPVYLWGTSLGSGVAAAVAADPTLPIRGLVLMTPFNRITGVALYLYPYVPVTLLVRDRYDSENNLAHFTHPVAVVRSDEDETIPPPLTLELYASLPEPKKMIVLHGVGHDNWPSSPELSWWDDALNFIAPK